MHKSEVEGKSVAMVTRSEEADMNQGQCCELKEKSRMTHRYEYDGYYGHDDNHQTRGPTASLPLVFRCSGEFFSASLSVNSYRVNIRLDIILIIQRKCQWLHM
jgi:hypothetical protein